jgi:hypothetical protein
MSMRKDSKSIQTDREHKTDSNEGKRWGYGWMDLSSATRRYSTERTKKEIRTRA